jgi:membrane associated rhomboid family serine protease
MVMPLKDIQERHTFPLVTIALIAVNAVFFFYELSLGQRLDGFLRSAAFVPVEYFAPGNAVGDARAVLLSMFLHGGWMHLLGNMLYLWIFGDNVEDVMGHVTFLVFYLVCGWAATLAHGYFNTASTVPAIGASGAISGVLGAYLVLFPGARVVTLIPLGFYMRMATLPAIIVLGLWFVIQAFSGLADLGRRAEQAAGVAWWAHIGGFVVGMALGVLFRGRLNRHRRVSFYGQGRDR